MELKFDKCKYNIDNEGFWLSLRVVNKPQAMEFIQNMKEKLHIAVLKAFRNKRSLEANAYCWILCQKLAEKLNTTKVEVYRKAIHEIGYFKIIPMVNEDVDMWKNIWEGNGYGWICDVFGDSKLEGYTNLICYFGSSKYNSKQMSVFIDYIVSECKEQGIETLTPAELERMKGAWGSETSKNKSN